MNRRLVILPIAAACLLGALLVLGACGGDDGTTPVPATGVFATHQATWGLTHGLVSASPNVACGSTAPWVEDETPLKTTTLVEGAWEGRTFTGAWTHLDPVWENFEASGTLEITVDRSDTVVTSFEVYQHIVWNEATDRHRHETARLEYAGPGLVLGDEAWGYVFRDFGDACCSGLSIEWSTWVEEDPDCVWTTERIECVEISSMHVGFYPRD